MQAGIRRNHVLAAAVVLSAMALTARAAEPSQVTIKMGVLPGLKFDQPRFAVPPGAKVTLVFHNPDQMIHNLVITEPGARNEIVMAALALGADGPAKQFVPDSKKVLWATKALAPGETGTLSFTAPSREDVYPYVCTYTGHGFVMYGAMYVTTKPMPPLESDPHLPPATPVIVDASDHSRHTLDRPVVSRTFLPDCGPAAVAIGLPGGQSYVFDAGACRLRYAWKGGFVDNNEHWLGKGEAWGKVVGRIYYRAPQHHPIRIGDVNRQPKVQWRGYTLDKAGYPQLRYTLDGVEVREAAHPKADGSGIEFAYEISSAPGNVYFVSDPEAGASFTASAGTFASGVLTLTAEQARRFTLTLTERPGFEPLAYYSMNDVIFPSKEDPEPGVVGRAFTPGGKGRKPLKLDTALSTAELRNGGTLMAWVKLSPAEANKVETKKDKKKAATGPAVQPIFSAGDGKEFVLAAQSKDENWHHVAAVFHGGHATVYLDGAAQGHSDLKLPAKDASIVIGSVDDKAFLKGLMDEVRIYNRALDQTEVRKIYQREKAASEVAR